MKRVHKERLLDVALDGYVNVHNEKTLWRVEEMVE